MKENPIQVNVTTPLSSHDLHSHQRQPILCGERVEIRPLTVAPPRLALVRAPSGSAVALEANTITPDLPGLYEVRIDAGVSSRTIAIVAFHENVATHPQFRADPNRRGRASFRQVLSNLVTNRTSDDRIIEALENDDCGRYPFGLSAALLGQYSLNSYGA